MAKNASAKTTTRAGTGRSLSRRAAVGRHLPRRSIDLRDLVTRPLVVHGAILVLALVALGSTLVIRSREQMTVQPGQVMTDTRLARVDFRVRDDDATNLRREEARTRAPQVYTLRSAYLSELAGELKGLPKALAGASGIDEVSPELRRAYGLDEAGLKALTQFTHNGESTPQWQRFADQLVGSVLPSNPIIRADEYQNYWAARAYSDLKRLMRDGDEAPTEINEVNAVPLPSEPTPEYRSQIERLVRRSGFPDEVVPFIATRIVRDARPTMVFDPVTSARYAEAAVSAVEQQYTDHARGSVLFRRGEILEPTQHRLVMAETRTFLETSPVWERWIPRVGLIGLIAVLAIGLAVDLGRNRPRVLRNGLRAAALGGLMVGMLATSILVAPTLPAVGTIGPILALGIMVLLAYGQRSTMIIGGIQAALVTLAIDGGVGTFLLLFTGLAAMTIQLREIRTRNSLIRAALVTGLALAVGSACVNLYQLPLVPGAWAQIVLDAIWSAAAALGIGFIALGTMPTLERLFGFVTGMTLAELRDPRQPLLRQLQQRAPGTYNHSLQVANLAENAADAIGADSLLVYVGAMYHDIGKLNKPEYFIENQDRGENKHAKLSPAMSLLVITAHVKDGIELAREYGLPRPLVQFIETHHGTTLVEYFYRAAQTKAAEEQKSSVNEFEYRYPGPKPQTREAAILMLSDAVESASRTMGDPQPSRIETLVRSIVNKRLQDGQFDDCDLSFRDLHLIEDALITRLRAIHHARISYPGGDESPAAAEPADARPESDDRPARSRRRAPALVGGGPGSTGSGRRYDSA